MKTIAERTADLPFSMRSRSLSTLTDSAGTRELTTVTRQTALFPSTLAVICVSPMPTPVTVPFSSTVATASSAEDQTSVRPAVAFHLRIVPVRV